MSTNCKANAWRFLAACASRVFTFSCTRTSWRLSPPADTPYPHPLPLPLPSLLWSSSCYAATLNLNSICCRFNIFLRSFERSCVCDCFFFSCVLSLCSLSLSLSHFSHLLYAPSAPPLACLWASKQSVVPILTEPTGCAYVANYVIWATNNTKPKPKNQRPEKQKKNVTETRSAKKENKVEDKNSLGQSLKRAIIKHHNEIIEMKYFVCLLWCRIRAIILPKDKRLGRLDGWMTQGIQCLTITETIQALSYDPIDIPAAFLPQSMCPPYAASHDRSTSSVIMFKTI